VSLEVEIETGWRARNASATERPELRASARSISDPGHSSPAAFRTPSG
jgi:hypothetical protein